MHVFETRGPVLLRISTEVGTVRIDASGSLAAVGAKTATGDLRFDVVSGDVSANSASGDIAIGEIGGGGKIRSASGDVSVGLGRGALSVNSASGDVRVDRALASIAAATASGDIEVGAVEAGEIRLQSVSGDVRVGVREGLRVWIDASSVSGTISSDLHAEDGPPDDGGAALEIHARTVSGDVGIVAAAGVFA